MIQLPRPILCLVTDRAAVDPSARTEAAELTGLEAVLDEAIAGGIDVIQIREAGIEARTLASFVRRVVARAAGSGTRVVVNDRADVAIAVGAHGVHLKSNAPPVAAVRRIVGAALVGRSIHDAVGAETDLDADYFVFGTVFPSPSKAAGTPAAGTGVLADVASRTMHPVLAIGGVTSDNASQCRAAGAAGVAAIRMFLPAHRTRAAIAALRAGWNLR